MLRLGPLKIHVIPLCKILPLTPMSFLRQNNSVTKQEMKRKPAPLAAPTCVPEEDSSRSSLLTSQSRLLENWVQLFLLPLINAAADTTSTHRRGNQHPRGRESVEDERRQPKKRMTQGRIVALHIGEGVIGRVELLRVLSALLMTMSAKGRPTP